MSTLTAPFAKKSALEFKTQEPWTVVKAGEQALLTQPCVLIQTPDSKTHSYYIKHIPGEPTTLTGPAVYIQTEHAQKTLFSYVRAGSTFIQAIAIAGFCFTGVFDHPLSETSLLDGFLALGGLLFLALGILSLYSQMIRKFKPVSTQLYKTDWDDKSLSQLTKNTKTEEDHKVFL